MIELISEESKKADAKANEQLEVFTKYQEELKVKIEEQAEQVQEI